MNETQPGNPGRGDAAYGAEAIRILEGLEAVRVRPAMYIGSTGEAGLHHACGTHNSCSQSLCCNIRFLCPTCEPASPGDVYTLPQATAIGNAFFAFQAEFVRGSTAGYSSLAPGPSAAPLEAAGAWTQRPLSDGQGPDVYLHCQDCAQSALRQPETRDVVGIRQAAEGWTVQRPLPIVP